MCKADITDGDIKKLYELALSEVNPSSETFEFIEELYNRLPPGEVAMTADKWQAALDRWQNGEKTPAMGGDGPKSYTVYFRGFPSKSKAEKK